jgi:hypothetical protein
VVSGPALDGPRWAGKGKGEGGAARREKEKGVVQRTSGPWARGPEATLPFTFFISFQPLSILDSNLNVNSNLKTHSNKLQIKQKNSKFLTLTFLYFLEILFISQ